MADGRRVNCGHFGRLALNDEIVGILYGNDVSIVSCEQYLTTMPQHMIHHESKICPLAGIGVSFVLFASLSVVAQTETPTPLPQPPHILVLDNCDSDYKVPPFNDGVLFLNSKGEVINKIGGLNICQNVGGNRAISVSRDGRFFVVCENVAKKITAYDLLTGNEIWSLPGEFICAAIDQGVTYALTSDGRIYGNGILAIDSRGNITKQSAVITGYDIVVDPNAKVLWSVGGDIKKCDMNLQAVRTIDCITWCAVSVAINPDGSIWVAEREHIDHTGSQNRLLKISSQGQVLQTVPLNDLSPLCVRVNQPDCSVWVTGICLRIKKRLSFRQWPPAWRRTYKYVGPRTYKYSPQGKLLLQIKRGGHSIDLDPVDGSVWIADRTKLWHYSCEGKRLGTCDDVSDDNKWITVVPGKDAGN